MPEECSQPSAFEASRSSFAGLQAPTRSRLQKKAKELLAQVDAYRDLSSSLAFD
jgi:hypothetical protein